MDTSCVDVVLMLITWQTAANYSTFPWSSLSVCAFNFVNVYCKHTITILIFIPRHLRRMMFLLQSNDLGVRIAAGELLALMYEMGRNVQEDFGYRDRDSVCNLIRELATEGTKHIAKKDLRQQRSSFRDILKTIEVCIYYRAACLVRFLLKLEIGNLRP